MQSPGVVGHPRAASARSEAQDDWRQGVEHADDDDDRQDVQQESRAEHLRHRDLPGPEDDGVGRGRDGEGEADPEGGARGEQRS